MKFSLMLEKNMADVFSKYYLSISSDLQTSPRINPVQKKLRTKIMNFTRLKLLFDRHSTTFLSIVRKFLIFNEYLSQFLFLNCKIKLFKLKLQSTLHKCTLYKCYLLYKCTLFLNAYIKLKKSIILISLYYIHYH